jgi:hypothetical protein
MSDNPDEKLDTMLRSRRFAPASPDLAQRIILKAQQLPQVETNTLGQWIKRVFSEFHLPKPAYVLASALILGFVLGMNAPSDTPDDTNSVNAQSFLYADEALLWLL